MDKNTNPALMAVVLAAGKGTRLHSEESDLPKVLRRAAGRPLLAWVLDAAGFIAPEDTVIVVGYKKEAVTAAFPGFRFAVQERQLGTGHAVMAAAEALRGFGGAVLVCCGDMPLLRRGTLEALVGEHFKSGNACTLLSGSSERPLAYGRVLRDSDGGFEAIVEARDCTPEQAKIRELNSGVYVFDAPPLLKALRSLGQENSQGEYYLTDVPAIMKASGLKVGVCFRELGDELLGVNTPEQLEAAERLLGGK